MKKSSHLFLSFILLLVTYSTVSSQVTDSTVIKKIKSYALNFKKFSANYPQEKVYLHFDNTGYYLGEPIWFKAYVVRADRNSLSQLSKVLYVELVSAEGYTISTKKLKIENGQCHGNFKIPTTNYGGFYEVRAYTRYMQNFGDRNCFTRVFPIYDKPELDGKYNLLITERANSLRIPTKRPEIAQKEKVDVTFYPEGGSLISGVNSRVAFKAVCKDGQNAVVSGSIFNDKGENVAELVNGYQGMGVFEFIPGMGTYKAKVDYNNKQYEFKLPTALPNGYVMTVNNLDSANIDIQIQKNKATPLHTLGLAITCRGALYGFQLIHFDTDNTTSVLIPKTMVPSGVSQLTLYNSEGKIESERLVFVNHHSQLKMVALQNKATYEPYEKATVNFELKDKRDNPLVTTFSVAVRDAATSAINNTGTNILTDLLLSSELKGYIEKPSYYFESDKLSRRRALDLLLMTQGWRRYDWKQMAGVSPFKVKQPLEDALIMDGTVSSLYKKKKMNNVDISMALIADSTSQRGTCKTDTAGTFNFALQDFVGDANLILQSKQEGKLKEMNVLLNRQFSPELKTYAYAEVNLTPEYSTSGNATVVANIQKDSLENYLPDGNDKLAMDKKQHLLKAVEVKAKRQLIKASVSYKVEKEMDIITDKDDWLPGDLGQLFAKMNKYVEYEACGFSFSCKYKGKRVIFIRANSTFIENDAASELSEGLNNDATITDGKDGLTGKVETTNNANNVNRSTTSNETPNYCVPSSFPGIDEVETIDLVESYGSIMRLCPEIYVKDKKIVLAVVHCKKRYIKENLGIRNTTFAGYSYIKEFFSPKYDNAALPSEKDYRRTLYWNPDVKTGPDGKASIEFYNNGTCKSVNVSAETVTANGAIGGI